MTLFAGLIQLPIGQEANARPLNIQNSLGAQQSMTCPYISHSYRLLD